MPTLALIGGGGFAKEVAEVARLNGYEVAACYAENAGYFGHIHRGYLDDLLAERDGYDAVALCVGATSRRSVQVRRELIAWLVRHALPAPPLVSPRAICAEGARLAPGVFVGHGAVVAVDAVVGGFSVINVSAMIGHDAVVGANVTVAPGAFIGGGASVGDDTLIGPLSMVMQGVRVGREVVLGAGCTALRPLKDGASVWPRLDRPVKDMTAPAVPA